MSRKSNCPFGLYITNSVQEEIGLRGAQMIAERIQPDVAIVTDVTHCTHTPMMNKIENGDVAAGKGPGVTYGPAVQNNLLQRIIDTADAQKFPLSAWQPAVLREPIPMHSPIPTKESPAHSSAYHCATCTPRWRWCTATTLNIASNSSWQHCRTSKRARISSTSSKSKAAL